MLGEQQEVTLNEMNKEQIVTAFRWTCCGSTAEINAGNQALDKLSHQPGFSIFCLAIAGDAVIETAIRLQAVIYLKNYIDSGWRIGADGNLGISAQEKAEIKALLLQTYGVVPDQLLRHVALIVSKIARLEGVRGWPQLIPTLADQIQKSEHSQSLQLHCSSLLILSNIIKALASKRLPMDRKAFSELSQKLIFPLIKLCEAHLQRGLRNEDSLLMFSCVHYSFKGLRFLLLYGVSLDDCSVEISRFVECLPASSIDLLKSLSNGTAEQNEHIKSVTLKFIQAVWKFALDIRRLHTLTFVSWMKTYLAIAFNIVVGSEFIVVPMPVVVVRCMNLLNDTLLCQEYKVANLDTPVESLITKRALSVLNEVFTDDNLKIICRELIVRYLILGQEDLASYLKDPETFVVNEIVAVDAWRYSIRPAAEALYVAVVHEYWNIVTPVICEWMNQITLPVDLENANEVLIREAMLIALGLAANEMYDAVDFDSLFLNIIIPNVDASCSHQAHKFLLRRWLWLCGQWAVVKFSKTLRPQLYALMCRALSGNVEIGIRLTATAVLKQLFDDFDFSLELFKPHIEVALMELISTLRQCQDDDSKSQVASCLSLMVEACGKHVLPFISPIVDFVPEIWQSEHHLLKCELFNLMGHLVKNLGAQSSELRLGLCQLLASALDASSSNFTYLLDAGLDLWLGLVENTAEPLPTELLDLFRFMHKIIGAATETFKTCGEIIKAYCAFRNDIFCQLYLPQVFESLLAVLKSRSEHVVSVDTTLLVLRATENCLKSYKSCASASIGPIVSWCVEAVMNHCESLAILSLALSVDSLCICENAAGFLIIVNSFKPQAVKSYIEIWLSKLESIAHDLERTKLHGLALAILLTTSNDQIEEMFPHIVNAIAHVIRIVCTKEDGKYVDLWFSSLVAFDLGFMPSNDDAGSTFSLTEHDKRCQRLRDDNPVYAVPIQAHVLKCLKAAEAAQGTERFAVLWQMVSSENRAFLQSLVFEQT